MSELPNSSPSQRILLLQHSGLAAEMVGQTWAEMVVLVTVESNFTSRAGSSPLHPKVMNVRPRDGRSRRDESSRRWMTKLASLEDCPDAWAWMCRRTAYVSGGSVCCEGSSSLKQRAGIFPGHLGPWLGEMGGFKWNAENIETRK